MTQLTRASVLLIALALVAAACGDSGTTTTTTEAEVAATVTQPTTAVATTVAAPTTTAPPATTLPPTTTTTAPPTTTTTVPPTTTTAAAAAGTPDEIVNTKIDAAIAVIPEGWTFAEDTQDEEVGEDFLFDICGPPGGYDIDNLGEDTAALRQIDIEAPADGSVFGGPMGDVEARAFVDEATAVEAFGFLQYAFGTEEGRDCLADELLAEFAGQIPVDEDSEPLLTIEPIDIDSAEVAVRIGITITTSGLTISFFVDYAAALVGQCTVVSTFLAIGEDPFPEDVANALMSAAVGAL